MTEKSFASVWDALANSPEEAHVLSLRSDLMTSIENIVAQWGLAQGEAAKRLGITRPRLNDLLRGKISKFSLDALATLAIRAGLHIKMNVKKPSMKSAA
jgi:predicted XRE-type DNA-binding protein